jgi:hypothetical protein
MGGSWQSGLSQNNFTCFFVPINILLLNCQVARTFTKEFFAIEEGWSSQE